MCRSYIKTSYKNGYVEQTFSNIKISKKNEIRVLTSFNTKENSLMVDLRKFSLYGGYDGKLKPTNKGIKFMLKNVVDIIKGLLDVLVENDMLQYDRSVVIKDLLS